MKPFTSFIIGLGPTWWIRTIVTAASAALVSIALKLTWWLVIPLCFAIGSL